MSVLKEVSSIRCLQCLPDVTEHGVGGRCSLVFVEHFLRLHLMEPTLKNA